MDQLSRARTLGAIVEKVERGLKASQANEQEPSVKSAQGPTNGHADTSDPHQAENASPVRRQTLEAIAIPLPRSQDGGLGLRSSGLVLVTDDGRGVAGALAAELRSRRHPVVVVSHSATVSRHGDNDDEAQAIDFTSPAAVDALIDRLRQRGPLAGIVHALPLQNRQPAGLDPDLWADRLGPEARGLFLLARSAAEDLARSAEGGGACLVACTAMGGGFASVGNVSDHFFPGQGAVAGIIKTLAREWPAKVRVRVVDFDPRDDVKTLCANLITEIGARDRRSEVGYLEQRRIALRVVPSPLPSAGQPEFAMAPGEPILVTGGARGITAVLATELARVWKPTFLLAGTTPMPRENESGLTAGITNPSALKSLLHHRLAEGKKAIGPAELERAYQALRRQREIRANIERLGAMGAEVDYAQVDVRDVDALQKVLARWQARFGPVRGLIHGAGVIQDKLLRDKTLDSFDRVLGTKIDSALNLANLLDPESLRFTAFFSSVAGRFGNRGQVDYAAANETLSKLAIWLDRRWAGRVVSLIWGPWSGVGMVSDLQGHLQGQGLGMISPSEDAHRLADELRLGRKGDAEVVIAGEIGSLLDPDEAPAQTKHQHDRANEELVMS